MGDDVTLTRPYERGERERERNEPCSVQCGIFVLIYDYYFWSNVPPIKNISKSVVIWFSYPENGSHKCIHMYD